MFSITTFADAKAVTRYKIVIDDFLETAPLILSYWTANEYTGHWVKALAALLNGDVDCCALITDIKQPGTSKGVVYWALYREGSEVYFHEMISFDGAAELAGEPTRAAKAMSPRVQGTPEEHAQVSEWVIDVREIEAFLRAVN